MSKGALLNGDLSELPESGLVVVGFSGGADSTALAHWLWKRLPIERIVLAHLNHGLRGEESERDEAAVRRFAGETGLRLVVSKADIAALAAQRGMGLEECGRKVRYEFFHSLAPGENDRILTAHHAGDNAETLLLNLCRGAGLDGLCGIPAARGKVLRPFLGVSREEIEAYCRENGLSYETDSTNLSGQFARNRIRLEVLPVLRQLNPKVVDAFSQTAELLSRDRDFIRAEGEKLLRRASGQYGLNAQMLLEAHAAVRSAALRLWLDGCGCQKPGKKHLDLVEDCLERGGAVSLPGGITLCRHQGILSAVRESHAASFAVPVSLPGKAEKSRAETPLPDGRLLVLEKKEGPFKKSGQKIHNLDFKNALDYDTIINTLIARTRRAGDRFSPAGRNVSKSMKQVFQECGVPAGLRGAAVLLECGERLVWCQGAGAAQGFQVTEHTRAALVPAVWERPERAAGK